MRGDVVLPAFQMDCRDWLVIRPSDCGLPEEVDGAPLVAMLSTAVISCDSMQSVSAVLTLGLLDDEVPAGRPAGDVAAEITGPDDDGLVRYVLPAPDRQLALLAEFRLPPDAGQETARRVRALMTSFRWAA